MSDVKVYDILPEAAQKAYISETKYQEMYTRSITEPDVFWAEQAKEFVTWFKGWDTVQNCDYHDGKRSDRV